MRGEKCFSIMLLRVPCGDFYGVYDEIWGWDCIRTVIFFFNDSKLDTYN